MRELTPEELDALIEKEEAEAVAKAAAKVARKAAKEEAKATTSVLEDPTEIPAEPEPEPEPPSEQEQEERSVTRTRARRNAETAPRPSRRTYVTTHSPSATFDIVLGGEDRIIGRWNGARDAVLFDVPLDLVERFERHVFVQQGTIVPLEG